MRVRVTDPKTGARTEINRVYEGITLAQAVAKQVGQRRELQEVAQPGPVRKRFDEYATSLYERKLATGRLKSAKSRERWNDTLVLHLVPAFGEVWVEEIRRADVVEWLAKQTARRRTKVVAGQVKDSGPYSPRTINGWLSILLVILREARIDLELDHDATEGVEPLDTSTRPTYTEEEPNNLTLEELPRFLAKARELYPQHYAMLVLGFSTGRRPSELRALRRKGGEPDILWAAGEVLVRRSVTLGEAMERTKTGKRLRIPLPEDIVAILESHARGLKGLQAESDLQFPSTKGGFRSGSCLDKPIAAIAKAAGISKHLTARCMRRTFQDLGRAAGVEAIVVRAISGHATASMQDHYSTVAGSEVRAGLERMAVLAGLRAPVVQQAA